MRVLNNMSHEQLMAYARNPGDVLTQAFAGAVCTAFDSGVFPALFFGLSEKQFGCLLDRYFPNAWLDLFAAAELTGESTPCPSFRDEEMQDLLALLLEHRSSEREESTWLPYAIAASCMGRNHLWQDMGLVDRQALSGLLKQNFQSLYDKNTGNMKWKKFFYKQLCERAEVTLCKAPSCQVCADYRSCFGPEEAVATALSNII
ncbi:MAG: nitrogen fixation protein NifQ [Hydrogenophilales bacterium]|nr:nitrogen fixation protein NifQ [Hydrogenophilales bacterium]